MIRPAKPDDLARLMEMGAAFNTEAGYEDSVPFVSEDFHASLCILGHANLLLSAEQDGQVVGMAAADVAPSLCNQGVRIGQEAFWYVDPNHRKGIGRKLLNALECTAKSQGATFMQVVAEAGKRSAALARLYEAAGYSPISATFRKRL
jgi:GNAT superfamily N-acetyltransferase